MDVFNFAAVVIVYNFPLETLRANVNSYINSVDLLLIIDNSEIKQYSDLDLEMISSKIKYYHMNGNYGIAVALNYGINRCIDLGYSWVLTMDQDSSFSTSLNPYKAFILDSNEAPAILSPRYRIEGTIYKAKKKTPHLLDKVIQSGNLINLAYFKKLNGYEEKYFIDYVDYEYCMRVRKKENGKIYCIPEVCLKHFSGDLRNSNLIGAQYLYKSQSSIRYYYTIRNGLDYIVRYRDYKQSIIILKGIFKIFLLESDKKEKIRYLIRGIKDYWLGNWGKMISSEKK